MLVKLYSIGERINAAELIHDGELHISADIGWNREQKLRISVSGTTLDINNEWLMQSIKCGVYNKTLNVEEVELEVLTETKRCGITEILFNKPYYENIFQSRQDKM